MGNDKVSGPLSGVKVLEFAGLGPAPFCCMLLSDMGADVLRIDRPGTTYSAADVEARGRHYLHLDLKDDAQQQQALSLADRADVLVEGFRPGVMERLGLGPDTVLARNPALVYGRMTGWGQIGPMARMAGHDLNYLALTGALHALGPREKPAIPLNLIADFGGGALYLAMGVLAALHHARSSGEGQVIDCAMTDGVISMMGMLYGDFAEQRWEDSRESNVIDGAAPFYNVYQCRDGSWLALACIEAVFFERFLALAELDRALFADQWDRSRWPDQRRALASMFADRDRDDWLQRFDGEDVCLTPVHNMAQSLASEHNRSRQSFVTVGGIAQPAPAPRFSRTAASVRCAAGEGALSPAQALARWR